MKTKDKTRITPDELNNFTSWYNIKTYRVRDMYRVIGFNGFNSKCGKFSMVIESRNGIKFVMIFTDPTNKFLNDIKSAFDKKIEAGEPLFVAMDTNMPSANSRRGWFRNYTTHVDSTDSNNCGGINHYVKKLPISAVKYIILVEVGASKIAASE